MFGRLFLLLTLLPLVEIALLAWLASVTSLVFVLALVILTGVLGMALVRHQSWHVLRTLSEDVRQGQMPAESLFDGALVLVAALLLILPGVLSDILAIVLLFPPSRRLVKTVLGRRLRASTAAMRAERERALDDRDRIIDVKVIDSPPRPAN